MNMKHVLLICLLVCVAVASAVALHMKTNKEHSRFAESARIALSAMEGIFAHAEDRELAFSLSLSNAESASQSLRAIALNADEVRFADSIDAKIQEASMCRSFMLHASIETARINPPCAARVQQLEPLYAKDIASLRAGKHLQ
jgi:hypothetical protein